MHPLSSTVVLFCFPPAARLPISQSQLNIHPYIDQAAALSAPELAVKAKMTHRSIPIHLDAPMPC